MPSQIRLNRFERSPKEKFFRWVVLAVVHVFVLPVLKIIDWLGFSNSVLGSISSRIQKMRIWPQRYTDYRPDEHDVFVCTYFKSGTNWMLQVAHQIANRGGAEFDHIHDWVPWPECPSLDFAVDLLDPLPQRESPTGLRIIKTHLEWSKIPYS
jgi:hypothetical protein